MGLATVNKIMLIQEYKVLMIDIKEPPKKYLKIKKFLLQKLDVTNFANLKKNLDIFMIKINL